MLARALWILMATAWAYPALAVDVDLSVNASGQYDTNVVRTDSGEKGDFSFRIGPRIALRDQIGKFQYNVHYVPNYQKFVQQDEFDKLSHFAGAVLDYQLGNKTSFTFTERFQLTQSVNQQSLGSDGDSTNVEVEPETQRGDVYINNANFVARHIFTPRTSGQFSLTHEYFDSDNTNSSRNTSLAGLTSLSYAVGARDRVGLGGGVTWQQFEGTRGQPASDTYTYRLFVSWLHNFGENTVFSIRGGPALITTQQDAPDPEGIGTRYPHLVVAQAGTVNQVYAQLGLETPAVVTGLMGNPNNPIAPGQIIPAGSLLVPDEDTCMFVTVSSATGLTPASCPYSRIARPGQNANNDAFIAAVQSQIIAPDPTMAGGLVNFTFPPGADSGTTDDSSITYFGEVSLTHNWSAKLLSSLAYSRSDSAATSLGSSTVADRVTFETKWEASRKLSLALRADWLQRKSANDLSNTFRLVNPMTNVTAMASESGRGVAYTGGLFDTTTDNAIDTTYYSASARAQYRLTRRVTLSARLTYQKQDTNNASTTSNSNFGDFIGFVGVRYDLDPLHF